MTCDMLIPSSKTVSRVVRHLRNPYAEDNGFCKKWAKNCAKVLRSTLYLKLTPNYANMGIIKPQVVLLGFLSYLFDF